MWCNRSALAFIRYAARTLEAHLNFTHAKSLVRAQKDKEELSREESYEEFNPMFTYPVSKSYLGKVLQIIILYPRYMVKRRRFTDTMILWLTCVSSPKPRFILAASQSSWITLLSPILVAFCIWVAATIPRRLLFGKAAFIFDGWRRRRDFKEIHSTRWSLHFWKLFVIHPSYYPFIRILHRRTSFPATCRRRCRIVQTSRTIYLFIYSTFA